MDEKILSGRLRHHLNIPAVGYVILQLVSFGANYCSFIGTAVMLNADGDLSARSPPGLGVYFYSAFNQRKFCGILGVVHEALEARRAGTCAGSVKRFR